MVVSSSDLLLVNRLTLRLYSELDRERQILATLDALRELVECRFAVWNQFNLSTRQLRLVSQPHFGPTHDAQAEAGGRLAHQSPYPAYFAASGDPSWRMITDFMPIEDFARTEFCVQALRDGGPHQIGCVLNKFDDEVRAITLHRGDSAFTERDRHVLNLIHPHLSLSHCNACSFERADRSARQFRAVVESAAIGYAYLGDAGQTEWSTAKARELWNLFYPDSARDELGVPVTVAQWAKLRLRRLSGKRPSLLRGTLRKQSDRGLLETRLVPAALGGWILAVEPRHLRARPRFQALSVLSARQNEVMRWMTEGKRNAEIAVILDISTRTVEKHVESILLALHVENRAGAIVAAMGMTAQNTPPAPGIARSGLR